MCEVGFYTMKKIKFRVTSKERERGLEYLNIYHGNMTREFNKNPWSGRDLKENMFYPIFYLIRKCIYSMGFY